MAGLLDRTVAHDRPQHMYENHTIGVVVPAYNEEGFVGDVIETVPSYVDRIYVVDDRSTDGTWAEIRRHAARSVHTGARSSEPSSDADSSPATDGGGTSTTDSGGTSTTDGGSSSTTTGRDFIVDDHGPATCGSIDDRSGDTTAFDRRVVPIRHDENRGVGGAIKTGYQYALADGIDVTAVMGGDGQMDPDQLHRLLDPIVDGEADYAKGNRLLHPDYRHGMSAWRLFGNWLLTFLTKIASGYWKTMDPQNGYTAISREALSAIDLDDMYEYYGYCNDLLVKLNVEGARVVDVGMPAIYGEETSSISYPSYVANVAPMLLRNFLWRLRVRYLVRDFHPLALCYLFGMAVGLVGLFKGTWSLVVRTRRSGSDGQLPDCPGSSAVLVALGGFGVLFGMVLDVRENDGKEDRIDGTDGTEPPFDDTSDRASADDRADDGGRDR